MFPILNLLLPLHWEAASPSTAHTIQHSSDLVEWTTYPAVFDGDNYPQTLTLDLPGSLVFARIRSDPNGDTNENGLPDHWEWSALGKLDVAPDADPDLDGVSNYEEWIGGTDPLNYFNGVQPVLELTCGKSWIVPTGSISHSHFSVVLRYPSGEPWADAPVSIRVSSGSPALVEEMGTPENSVPETTCRTDSLGRIPGGSSLVHFQAGAGTATTEVVVISAGMAMDYVKIIIVDQGFGDPPRNLQSKELADGQALYQWSGPPNLASNFIIEEQAENGEWVCIANLSTTEMPSPDPVTGTYEILLQKP